MVDRVEEELGDQTWLSGQAPGDADKEALTEIGNNRPNVSTHPNAFAWYSLVSKFTWAQEILANAAPVAEK